MSYLITFVRREGQQPVPVNAPHGINEAAARAMAENLAGLSRRVTLSELDGDGESTILARWDAGKPKQSRVTIPRTRPVVIEHEHDDAPDADDAILTELDGELDPEAVAIAAAESDDEVSIYEAYCVKCKVQRAFHGEIGTMSNGRRMAQGNCPVCGTKITRILKNVPLSEDFHTPDDEPDDELPGLSEPPAPKPRPAAEPVVVVVEHQEPDEVPAEAQAVAEPVVVAFSDAEEVKPAKRRTRKAKAAPVSDADVERVKEMQVAECPQCRQRVPYQTREVNGKPFSYFLTHPGDGRERCLGSMGTVEL